MSYHRLTKSPIVPELKGFGMSSMTAPFPPLQHGTICAICGGQFDTAEWNASRSCPECEQPKRPNPGAPK